MLLAAKDLHVKEICIAKLLKLERKWKPGRKLWEIAHFSVSLSPIREEVSKMIAWQWKHICWIWKWHTRSYQYRIPKSHRGSTSGRSICRRYINVNDFIERNRSISTMRLGSRGLERVPPWQITLNLAKKPVKVKSVNIMHCKVLDGVAILPSWIGILEAQRKSFKAISATIGAKWFEIHSLKYNWLTASQSSNKSWAVTRSPIEAELNNFKQIRHLATLYFWVGSWQCPLHSTLYDFCYIITPEGNFAYF